MSRRIGPLDPLEIGQPVAIGNEYGTVIKCEYVQAHPCGMIYVHTIRVTAKRVFKRMKSGVWSKKLIEVKPVDRRVNYSGITVIEGTEHACA